MLLTSSEFGYETNTDDASILVYKFRLKRTGFNMYAEYTRQLTFLALHPWPGVLAQGKGGLAFLSLNL